MADGTSELTEITDVVAIGGELGTSSSKFCCDDTVVIFSSVVGSALSEGQENSWRHMNRSTDTRWIKNLAIFDEKRNAWRYVGAMTRRSEKADWFTHKGLIRDYEDAVIAIKAGLFLQNLEMEKKGKTIKRMGLGFGITVHHGENVIEKFFSYLKERMVERDSKRYLQVKAKNVASNTIRDMEIQIEFCVMQYQAYGAYMAIMFKKFNMEVRNTYVIDIGHGTWIKLPIVENEAEIGLADSITEGIFTITKNISNVIFETSQQKFKIPEQRIMERLPSKDYKIEVPGSGVYDFTLLLEQQCAMMASDITKRVISDITALSQKGQSVDYFTIIGGGAHLLFDKIKENIRQYFAWTQAEADERVVHPSVTGVDSRYVNCVGFMLLARDHMAIELGKDVDPTFEIKHVIQDFGSPKE